jgi:uncharacterized protein (TIGR02996 family)
VPHGDEREGDGMTATDATAFRTALAADPHDATTVAVFADWLDERLSVGEATGRVACSGCGGEGRVLYRPGPQQQWLDCPDCCGDKTVPLDYRAEAYTHRLWLANVAARASCVCGACGGRRISRSDPQCPDLECLACSGTGTAFTPAARDILLAAHDQYAGEAACPKCSKDRPGWKRYTRQDYPEGKPDGYKRPRIRVRCETCSGTGRVPNAAADRAALIRAAAELEGMTPCGASDPLTTQLACPWCDATKEHARLLARVRADVFAGVPHDDCLYTWLDRRGARQWFNAAATLPDSSFRHGVGLWEFRCPWEVWAKVGLHLYGRELLAGGVTLTTMPAFGPVRPGPVNRRRTTLEGGRAVVEFTPETPAVTLASRLLAADFPGLKFRLPGES